MNPESLLCCVSIFGGLSALLGFLVWSASNTRRGRRAAVKAIILGLATSVICVIGISGIHGLRSSLYLIASLFSLAGILVHWARLNDWLEIVGNAAVGTGLAIGAITCLLSVTGIL